MIPAVFIRRNSVFYIFATGFAVIMMINTFLIISWIAAMLLCLHCTCHVLNETGLTCKNYQLETIFTELQQINGKCDSPIMEYIEVIKSKKSQLGEVLSVSEGESIYLVYIFIYIATYMHHFFVVQTCVRY